MMHWKIALLFLVALAVTPSQAAAQDVVHTKDGGIHRGRIVEEIPDSILIIQTTGGSRYPIRIAEIERIQRGEWLGKKSATASWALSFFLLPGLGQFYNGDNTKGMLMSAVGISSAVLLYTGDEDDASTTVAAVAYLTNWVWSFIDAPVRSRAISRERGYTLIEPFPDRWADIRSRPQFTLRLLDFDL